MEDFWNFSKRERIGIFGIVLLIMISFIGNQLITKKVDIKEDVRLAFEQEVSEALIRKEALMEEKKEKAKVYANKYSMPKKEVQGKTRIKNLKIQNEKVDSLTPILTNFNPNLATKSELIQLGIPERIAQIILNFRNRGGKFYKPEDLKIIYGFPARLYTKLEPYINIPKPDKKPKAVLAKIQKKIDLNLCTAEELMELRGIGPTLSERIIKFRSSLGGFYDPKQLLEIYQLPDSTYQAVIPHFSLTPIIKKANINDFEIPKLIRHPYLSQATIGALISLKDHEGKFTNWESIEKNIKITKEELENIKQYFTIH